MLFMRTRHFTLPEHNIISLSAVCVCELTQADITYRGRAEQKLVPLKLLLLAVNNANKDFVSSLSPSHISPLFLSLFLLSFTFSFVLSPYFYPSLVSVYLLFSIHLSSCLPFPSALLARWLVYHWDGCRIKDATLFFPPLLLFCLSHSPV